MAGERDGYEYAGLLDCAGAGTWSQMEMKDKMSAGGFPEREER